MLIDEQASSLNRDPSRKKSKAGSTANRKEDKSLQNDKRVMESLVQKLPSIRQQKTGKTNELDSKVAKKKRRQSEDESDFNR